MFRYSKDSVTTSPFLYILSLAWETSNILEHADNVFPGESFMLSEYVMLERNGNVFDYCCIFFSWNDEPCNQSRPHEFLQHVAEGDMQGIGSDK